MPWIYDPHSGGTKVTEQVKEQTKKRILAHAEKHFSGKYTRIDVRFRSQFCYIDAFQEPDVPESFTGNEWETREKHIERLRNTPTHLCRLRYLEDIEAWSLAFYTYSQEKYEPTFFQDGSWVGTPEDAFNIGAVYLQ